MSRKPLKGGVSLACQSAVNRVKDQKKHRFVIFDIRKNFLIDIRKTGRRGAEYEEFRDALQSKGPGECCYGLFDYNSPIATKLFLIMYIPHDVQFSKKAIYQRGFMAMRRLLKGVQKFIIATDPSELCPDSIEEKLRNPDPVITFARNPRGSRMH